MNRDGQRSGTRTTEPVTAQTLQVATWPTGTDERNAEAVAATRERAGLLVPAALMHRLGAPPV